MQKKNKIILHIIHSEIGGAGDIAINLNEFENKDFEVQYLLTGPKVFYGFINKLTKIKKKFFFQKIKKGSHFTKMLEVIKKIKVINPELIILHNYQVLPSIFFKLFKKKKIIYIDHMSLKLKKFKDYISIFLSFIFFDRIVFINTENYNKFKYINNSKKKLIFNSSNDFFHKKKIYKKKNYLKVGISGRINHLKNHKIVLDLLDQYPYLKSQLKIEIAGSGENKNNLLKYVHKYQLSENVKFLGELDEKNLKKWFGKLDLYLHPSFGEAMSSSILQAMSSNTPILASNVNGINNLIGRKKYLGLLFNNKVENLKKKIDYFLNIKKIDYKKFQQVQRKYFLKKHDIKKFKMQYQRVINELI